VTTNLNRLLSPGETTIYTTTPVYQTEDPTGVYGAIECSELETDTLTVTGTLQSWSESVVLTDDRVWWREIRM